MQFHFYSASQVTVRYRNARPISAGAFFSEGWDRTATSDMILDGDVKVEALAWCVSHFGWHVLLAIFFWHVAMEAMANWPINLCVVFFP